MEVSLDDVGPGSLGSGSESVKIMAEKHSVIRAHLEGAEAELEAKKFRLKQEEERVREKAGEICITDQNLRSLNEKIYHLHHNYTEQEKRQQELLNELVEIQWKMGKTTEEIQNKKRLLEKMRSEQTDFIKKVQVAEVSQIVDNDPEYIKAKTEVDDLLELKSRLEKGDPQLKNIWTGQSLQIIEAQKAAIHDAFSEREIEAELMEAELEEKNKAIQKTQQGILIDEKQNQARLRILQKQLQELHETEKHLRSTVQHMEKQIDYHGR